MKRKHFGFTIVELMVVIVILAILATISIVSYNNVIEKSRQAKRENDMQQLVNAIKAARGITGKTLGEITQDYWSIGRCTSATYNPSGTEPRDLPKTHACWVQYYSNLDKISQASGVDLKPLRSGDGRGNPYMWDENEGEGGNKCRTDSKINYFTGNGVAIQGGFEIPKVYPSC